MPDPKYFTLDDLYRFLTPRKNGDQAAVVETEAEDIIRNQLLHPKGIVYTFEQMKSNIDGYFGSQDNIKNNVKLLSDLSTKFRLIGKRGVLNGEDKYWKDSMSSPVTNIVEISNEVKDTPDVTFAIVRDPQISPAFAGTDKIGRFLNYTPSIVASQMVPYLDVKFSYTDSNSTTKTPGIIRFLLGSVQESKISANDRILDNNIKRQGTDDTEKGLSGMEVFLMPQTLSNMDDLYATMRDGDTVRVVAPKPFVPLASIEGFDVTVQNAGAGSFASKRGNLKFKIHDKHRVSEFAHFLKGSSGAAFMAVTTTFGWQAPEGRDDIDEFCKFINTYMKQTDTWAVVNTQFAFDATGQVNIGVQLASNPTTNRGPVLILTADETKLRDLQKRMNEIKLVADELSQRSVGVLPKTDGDKTKSEIDKYIGVLNTVGNNGIYNTKDDKTDIVNKVYIKKMFDNKYFKKLVSDALGGEDKVNDFKEKLVKFLPTLDDKKPNPDSKESIIAEHMRTYKTKFDTMYNTVDPFLPRGGTDFEDDLVNAVESFKKPTVSTTPAGKVIPEPQHTPAVGQENSARGISVTVTSDTSGTSNMSTSNMSTSNMSTSNMSSR